MENKKNNQNNLARLWDCSRVLKAIGELLEQQNGASEFENISGLGLLLTKVGEEIANIEEHFRCSG